MLLNLDSGHYFGLDEVGTRVWRLLEPGSTWTEIRDSLLAESDLPKERLEADLDELFSGLVSHGLVQARPR